MAKKEHFRYRPREKDAVKKRANQSGGLFDSLFKSQFATFTPKEGDYRLRVLPPTWEDAQHFGLDIYVHYGIGSDNQSYLCLDKMCGEKCPVCEQRKLAERSDPEYARGLSPTKRVLVWIIDRDDEETGPQLWSMAWTIDRDLANLSIDKGSGELLLLDDPNDGYDIEFTRTGTGLKTKYSGTAVARRSSPLSDDADQADNWLRFVQTNPLPEVLQYFDYDHISSVAEGAANGAKDKDDEDGTKTRSKSKRGDDDEEDGDEDEAPPKPKKRSRVVEEEDEEDDLPPRRAPKKNREDDDDRPDPRRARSAGSMKRSAPATSRSEDEDDDDEDEAPPKPKKRSRVVEEEDEEDEDEAPPKRRSSRDDDDEESDNNRTTRKRFSTR